ncbi:MAG: hypothetical protein ACYDEI_00250 [Erysipelotrichaceae bacterium]
MKELKDLPERIFATRVVGTNGIHCLDYKCEEEDIEYIKATQNLFDRNIRVKQLLEEIISECYEKSFDGEHAYLYTEVINLDRLKEILRKHFF